jgi:hypothetical protein
MRQKQPSYCAPACDLLPLPDQALTWRPGRFGWGCPASAGVGSSGRMAEPASQNRSFYARVFFAWTLIHMPQRSELDRAPTHLDSTPRAAWQQKDAHFRHSRESDTFTTSLLCPQTWHRPSKVPKRQMTQFHFHVSDGKRVGRFRYIYRTSRSVLSGPSLCPCPISRPCLLNTILSPDPRNIAGPQKKR